MRTRRFGRKIKLPATVAIRSESEWRNMSKREQTPR